MTAPDVGLGWRALSDRRPGGVRSFLRAAWDADPRGLLVLSGLAVLLPLLTSLGAYALKVITDGLIQRRPVEAMLGLAVLATCQSLPRAVSNFQSMRASTMQERAGVLIRHRVNDMLLDVPGIEHYERPLHQDQMSLLRAGLGQLVSGAFLALDVLSAVVQLVISAVLLASITPWLLLLAPLGLLSLGAAVLVERRGTVAALVTAERQRLTARLHEHIRRTSPAEIRVRREGRVLDERLSRQDREAHALVWRTNAVSQTFMTLASIVVTAGVVGAVVLVASQAAQGKASVGDVALTAALAGRLADSVTAFAQQFQQSLAFLRSAGRFSWLADFVEASAHRPLPEEPVPARLRAGIRLEGLSFTYPGTQAPVLRDVDLFLPAGSTVALVGDNGAGKTTLVKLLCAFYTPTSGRLLVDGTDLRAFDAAAWRSRTTACFQDHFRPEVTALNSVGIGEPALVDDERAVDAAVRSASARQVVDELPQGYAQQLGRSFSHGIEPSGGQWQQLALARSMLRGSPLLVLLDEPTAALDPEAEHRLFLGYTAAARAAAVETGGITLMVSHRFSTVRRADLIVVIEGGRVVEQGSHEELVGLQGRYAAMYDVQARAYR